MFKEQADVAQDNKVCGIY